MLLVRCMLLHGSPLCLQRIRRVFRAAGDGRRFFNLHAGLQQAEPFHMLLFFYPSGCSLVFDDRFLQKPPQYLRKPPKHLPRTFQKPTKTSPSTCSSLLIDLFAIYGYSGKASRGDSWSWLRCFPDCFRSMFRTKLCEQIIEHLIKTFLTF